MALFTSANARQMADIGREKRRLRKLPPAVIPSPVQSTTVNERDERVTTLARTINNLIDMTTDGFAKAKTPRDQQCLAMALDRLLGSWSLLTGHPRPGVRRVSRETSRPPGPTLLPMEPDDPPSPEPL